MSRVLVISGSPALDRVVLAPGAARGGTVRTAEVLDTPGGKALHAAIVAGLLGVDSEAVVPLGGQRGARVERLLAAEPVTLQAVAIEAETRRTTTVVDPEAGDVLELLEPTPLLTPSEAGALVECAHDRAAGARVIIVSGSAPRGADDLPARLVSAVRHAGAFVVLDTSGPALAAAISVGADLVAPNLLEACALLGQPVPPDPDTRSLGRIAIALRSLGPHTIWLTAGRLGSILATPSKTIHLSAPRAGAAVNAVGCGDALLGGFAAGLAEELDLVHAASLGVAAATSKLTHLHPARIDPPLVRRLVNQIAVRELDGAPWVAAR